MLVGDTQLFTERMDAVCNQEWMSALNALAKYRTKAIWGKGYFDSQFLDKHGGRSEAGGSCHIVSAVAQRRERCTQPPPLFIQFEGATNLQDGSSHLSYSSQEMPSKTSPEDVSHVG